MTLPEHIDGVIWGTSLKKTAEWIEIVFSRRKDLYNADQALSSGLDCLS
jgi:hypothetical protein